MSMSENSISCRVGDENGSLQSPTEFTRGGPMIPVKSMLRGCQTSHYHGKCPLREGGPARLAQLKRRVYA